MNRTSCCWRPVVAHARWLHRSRGRATMRLVGFNEQVRQVGGVGDEGSDALTDEAVRTDTRCAGHWSWNGTHDATKLMSALRDGQRTGACSGLDDHCCGR